MNDTPKLWRTADKYLNSLLLLDRFDSTGASDFHGAFVPAVAESYFLRLTRPGSWTWDPFAGSGTTGRTSNGPGLWDRRVFMTDLNPKGAAIERADAQTVYVADFDGLPVIPSTGDSYLPPFLFDLIILHPPYRDIVVFSDTPGDLSTLTDTDDFLESFELVVTNVYRHLKPGGFIGLVVGDIWQTGEAEWVPLGFYCMQAVLESAPDLSLRAIQIKDIKNNRQDNRRNLRRARCFNAGTVEFKHEYMFTFKRAKR